MKMKGTEVGYGELRVLKKFKATFSMLFYLKKKFRSILPLKNFLIKIWKTRKGFKIEKYFFLNIFLHFFLTKK